MSLSSRRDIVRGQWNPASSDATPLLPCAEIVSLIVSTWPQHLDAVAEAILAIPNAEIHGCDPKGKLIVVLEEPTQGAIGARTNHISGLPHVLSAVMVFQCSDPGEVAV